MDFKRDTLAAKNCSLLKNVLLMLEFHDEGHLYSNCLFYILTIYHKCLLFQFLGSLICMQIPFLTEVQNGRLICEENGRILVKECLVLSLFLEVKSHVC